MSSSDDLSRLMRYQEAFAASIAEVPADAAVTHCGDWTVRDLVHHLAQVHLWSAHRAGGPCVPFEPSAALCPEYRRAASVLADTLTTLDPDLPCWTLLDDDVPPGIPRIGTVRFWHGRQANETLVHLWDLRTAGGLGLVVPAEEWLACLLEVVTVLAPRQVRLGRVEPRASTVRFAVIDGPVATLTGVDGGPEVAVHGTAEELALLAWGRLDADALAVDGDRYLLASALSGIVP